MIALFFKSLRYSLFNLPRYFVANLPRNAYNPNITTTNDEMLT